MSPEFLSHYEPSRHPQELIVKETMSQSGILPDMMRRNPELSPRLIDFIIGKTRVLVVGGESGMGKSLMTGDIRELHRVLQPQLPAELLSQLCILSWDRTHQAFFEGMSTAVGETIPLPAGETHPTARSFVSRVMADQIVFAQKYIPNSRVLVECPLIDIRGETLFAELPNLQTIQTFIMYSPRSRYETLQQGRLMATSGQPDAMNEIRGNLLKKILGVNNIPTSHELQDAVIKKWWEQQVSSWNGLVVEWDPDDNRTGLAHSISLFQQQRIKPDVISPRQLSHFTSRQFRSVLDVVSDIDHLLSLIAPN